MKIDEVIKRISPENLYYKGDELKEYLAIDDLKALMFFDESLDVEDLGPLRKAARRQEKTDLKDLIDDFKAGLLFISSFYNLAFSKNDKIEKRQEQIRGSKYIYMSSYFKSNFIGEYPTGSGKSFMYLISACAQKFIRNENTAIVTSGINLQEQLDDKDIPAISDIYYNLTGGLTLHYGVLKGRQNYICNKKLQTAKKAVDSNASISGVSDMIEMNHFIKSIPEHFNGDISNVPAPLKYDGVRALTCKSNKDGGCNRCSLSTECFYMNHKKNVLNAAIKVINYHMLFTEIEVLNTLGYISGASDNYVFDEAHEIARIGRDFSEVKFSKNSIKSLANTVTQVDNMMTQRIPVTDKFYSEIIDKEFNKLISDLESSYSIISESEYHNRKASSKWFSDIIIEEGDFIDFGECIDILNEIEKRIFEDIHNKVTVLGFENYEALVKVSIDSGNYEDEVDILDKYKEAEELCLSYKMFLLSFKQKSSGPKKRRLVKWVSQDKKDKRVSFHSKEINVTGINEYLFDNPTISTASVSATLSAGKSFDFFRSNLDLDRLNTSYEVISPSPFNLKEQELWFLPKNALSASKKDTDGEEYNRMVAENLSKLLSLSGGGMLVLFTSYKAMQEAYNMVSFSNPHTRILLQGDKPRKKLIEDFSDDMDSSLFGTRSFFTGVDVQGKSLRVLVIDKLPFENPSDPVTRTLSSGPSGFYNYSIPNMLMMLKQIIGRGVRSKTDKCAIVFFDKRISKSSYSKIIKRTFESSGNHAPRTTSIARVQDFLDNYK